MGENLSSKKQRVYVFGNELLDFDNMPIKLLPKLRQLFPEIEFVITDPNENVKPENGRLYIIDTVMGLSRVMALTDVDQLADEPKYSMHDFDLGFQLKLLKKIGQLKHVTIFGVPPDISQDDAVKQMTKAISICDFR